MLMYSFEADSMRIGPYRLIVAVYDDGLCGGG